MVKRSTLDKRFAREDQESRQEFIKAAMQHKEGRKFFWWLLGVTKAIGQPLFTTNALTTAFNLGEKNIGDQLMSELIQVVGAGFADMMKEMEDERRERNGKLSDATGDGGSDGFGNDLNGGNEGENY